jgi:hypothetical protein
VCAVIPGSTTCLPTAATPQFSVGTAITLDETGAPVILPADAVNAGFVRYDVVAGAPAGTLALVATPSDAALHTARYGTALRNVWNKSADMVSTHMQSRRDALWSMGGTPVAGKFWIAMSGSQDTIRASRRYGTLGQTNVTDMGVRQDVFGGQLGRRHTRRVRRGADRRLQQLARPLRQRARCALSQRHQRRRLLQLHSGQHLRQRPWQV